jgi:outer membrane receptor protein involved in Fe transport
VEGQARIGDRLSVLAGSRVEQYRGIDAAIVPRATAVFDLVSQRLAVRAAAGRAYKAPNIQDQFPNNPFIVGNPDLRPETSTSWELGTDVTLPRTTGSLTVFRQSYDNLIRSVNYDASGRQINRNLGRSRASGLEAEVAVHPRARLSFGAGGSWTMTKVLDNRGLPADQFPNGEALPFRPTHTATAFVELPAARSISVLFRATSVGRQTVLTERFSGERRSVGPYSVISASGTFTLSRWLEAYLHAQNVLNERYETGYDRPGAPRSAAAGLRVRR